MEVNTENKFEFNPKMIARIMQFVILGQPPIDSFLQTSTINGILSKNLMSITKKAERKVSHEILYIIICIKEAQKNRY